MEGPLKRLVVRTYCNSARYAHNTNNSMIGAHSLLLVTSSSPSSGNCLGSALDLPAHDSLCTKFNKDFGFIYGVPCEAFKAKALVTDD